MAVLRCLRFFSVTAITTVSSLGLLWVAGPLASASTQEKGTPLCVTALPDRFDRWLQEPALQGATIGVALETLDGAVLYHYQADRRFVPASTQKLLTTAAALEQWGGDRTWQTTVYLNPEARELWVVGQGDPTFTEESLRDLARQVAHQLQRRKITHLDRLVGDDRFLGEGGTPPTWEIGDTRTGYGAPANGLVLTENAALLTLWPQQIGEPLRLEWETPEDALDWDVENFSVSGGSDAAEFVSVSNWGRSHQGRSILRVEGVLQAGAAPEPVSVAVSEPGLRFLQHFQRALASEGITIAASQLLSTQTPPSEMLLFGEAGEMGETGETIATHSSPPLRELITIANQQSQNLYAEILLRWLGKTYPHPTDLGLAPSLHENGIQQLTDMLLRWGLTPSDFTIADGSGLSRQNSLTPTALVQVLQHSAQAPWFPIYRASLSEAGQSGTLASRFAQTPLDGKLWGKTGSMTGTMALAGYLNPDTYSPLAFSILINQSTASYGQLSGAIDRILAEWVNLGECSELRIDNGEWRIEN
jgi:serine-type D-Ala-D-Ala carboxypeptidase/endopeptidase (penicillin-binding protein 4)